MSGELGVVKTYADLHAIVRQRVADLNVSHASVDHVAGLNDGYFGKLMARMKHLGPQTMPLVLCALGIKLVAVVDVEAQEAYTKRMPTRETAGKKMPAEKAAKTNADMQIVTCAGGSGCELSSCSGCLRRSGSARRVMLRKCAGGRNERTARQLNGNRR